MPLGNLLLDFLLLCPCKICSGFTLDLLQFQKTYCYLEAKDLELLSPEAGCEEVFSVLVQLTAFTVHGYCFIPNRPISSILVV